MWPFWLESMYPSSPEPLALKPWNPSRRVLGLRGALVRYLRQLVQDPERPLLLPVASEGSASGTPTLLLLRDTLYQVRTATSSCRPGPAVWVGQCGPRADNGW